jgi:hypothetical protein
MNGAAARTARSLPGLAAALVRAWWPQVAALAAACGVVAATLVGALGVGSAMQHSIAWVASTPRCWPLGSSGSNSSMK